MQLWRKMFTKTLKTVLEENLGWFDFNFFKATLDFVLSGIWKSKTNFL